MKDRSKNIDYKNRTTCNWNGYSKLYDDFEDWLYNKTPEIRGDFIDNLDAIIYFYNQESGGMNNRNPILEYIKGKGMKILKKNEKYFSNEDKLKYKECFE